MKDYTYRYSVTMTLAKGYTTPAGWATRSRVGHRIPPYLSGAPTDAKLARYVADYNASLAPGGCNSHIGPTGRCVAAMVRDHDRNAIVATWAEGRDTARND